MRVLLAPDSFKGTLPAADVAAAAAEGWSAVRPADELVLLPQADGGEGTLDAVRSAVPGSTLGSAGAVSGPDGRPVEGRWLRLPDGTAVIELAQMSGLSLMRELDALHASTRGLGETIAAALDAGAEAVTLALGGSASTDGAAGALVALGLRCVDAHGRELPDGGGALRWLSAIDRSGLRRPPSRGTRILSDVSTPLLGAEGAAAVFGPQKGATIEDIALLDEGLARWARVLGGDATAAGAGAAGGAGFGFLSAWDAAIESGAQAVAEITGLTAAAAQADILLTGEGQFDRTSLRGKVVGEALRLAERHGLEPVVIAGRLAATPRRPEGSAAIAVALIDVAGSVEAALSDPARWTREAAAEAARRVTARR